MADITMEIYDMFADMDYQDYEETIDEDLEYIRSLICRYGKEKTIQILKERK